MSIASRAPCLGEEETSSASGEAVLAAFEGVKLYQEFFDPEGEVAARSPLGGSVVPTPKKKKAVARAGGAGGGRAVAPNKKQVAGAAKKLAASPLRKQPLGPSKRPAAVDRVFGLP